MFEHYFRDQLDNARVGKFRIGDSRKNPPGLKAALAGKKSAAFPSSQTVAR